MSVVAQDFPKISIVTPSFNQAQFLEATIQSILSQNYPNLEYIIIDGGSTDGSQKIIEKYEKHLYYWCSEPDAGQYDAINKGFARSTGEVMAWLNSDDLYFPWTLKSVASIFSELQQVEWLTTLQPGFFDYHGFCKGFISISGYSKDAFLDGCYLPSRSNAIGWIQQESTFWRRSLWQKVDSQLRTIFKLAGDFDLWSRFCIHADIHSVDSPLGGFRFQENQKSRQREQYLIEAENSLSNTTKLLSWQPRFWKKLISTSKVTKIPILKKQIALRCGYSGKKITRKNFRQLSSNWQTEEYKFVNNVAIDI